MSEVKTNKITSLASNNDITLDPDGTGNTNVDNGDFLFLEEAASSPYPEQKIKWSNDSTTANGFYVSQDTSRNGRVWHEQGVDLVFGTTNTERMRIDSSGRVTMTYQPAFRATLITSTNTTGNYMIFESVDYNIGNHYNATTGIFTAPIAGRYMVSVQGFNENSQSSQLYVRVNNANKSYSLSYGPTYGMMSQHSVFNLAANDTVRVYCNAGELYAAGADSNSFSCYLLG